MFSLFPLSELELSAALLIQRKSLGQSFSFSSGTSRLVGKLL